MVQWLPENTPRAAPLATLGWLNIESYIATRKLMFLFGILSLPVSSIYRKVAVKRTVEIMTGSKEKVLSPLRNLIEFACQYKMLKYVMMCMENELCISYKEWKVIIKKHILEVDML